MKKINDVANNMADEVVQQECNNNKSYALAFIYIYIYIYTLLVIRQIQDKFSTSRNMLFKSSIKDMKIGPRNK